MHILFRWTFVDPVGTFERASSAAFVSYAPTVPLAIRAYDLSRPYIGARVADGGETL